MPQFIQGPDFVRDVAARILTEGSGDGGSLDLRKLQVLVPTAEAGRRLTRALATEAANAQRGLLLPGIQTPSQWLRQSGTPAPESSATLLAVWVGILEKYPLDNLSPLFPSPPPKTLGWRIGFARKLRQLQEQLNENGHTFSTVARHPALVDHPEQERWHALADLEAAFFKHLNELKIEDPLALERAAAESGDLLENPPDKILLCGIASPLPLALRRLEKLRAAGISIEVWTFGTGFDEAAFDSWGRPLAEHWTNAVLEPDPRAVEALPISDRDEVWEILIAEHTAQATEVIGVVDPPLTPRLGRALATLDATGYDPSGNPLTTTVPGRLMRLLLDLYQDDTFDTVRAIAENVYAFQSAGPIASHNATLRELDKIATNHLPRSLASLHEVIRNNNATTEGTLSRLVEMLANWRGQLRDADMRGEFAATAAKLLAHLLERACSPRPPADRPNQEAVRTIAKLCREIEQMQQKVPAISHAVPPRLFRLLLDQATVYDNRDNAHIDFSGWLELAWIDQPELIVAGMRDGILPQTRLGDAFLPDSLRSRLGLPNNASRYAADSYLFYLLCSQRANGRGRLIVPITATAPDGNPARPSKLLFRTQPDNLLARITALFPEKEHRASARKQSGGRSPTFRPPLGLPMPETLSATALRDYISCPFRFFLKYILGMREPSEHLAEMNAGAFGSMIHAIAEQLKGSPLTRFQDRSATRRLLGETTENLFRQRFGKRISFALAVQKSLLDIRLDILADQLALQAASQPEASIHDTEIPVQLSVGALLIKGRIDRLDHPGADSVRNWRVIDYKTGASPKKPEEVHCAKIPRAGLPEHLADADALILPDGDHYWTDLQLPLYADAARTHTGGALPAIAFCNIAESAEKSATLDWDAWNENLAGSAQSAANAIVTRIRSGRFWPPNAKLARSPWDPFEPLFPEGIERTFDAELLSQYPFS